MGIPSYYRTLVKKIPHALQRSAPASAAALLVDMNCMIYHVLREPAMMAYPYTGESGRLDWERKLQNEVCSYLLHIWRSSGSPLQTYIALDGVVPYAKIKQQRFRRFKSASVAKSSDEHHWDTNAITPGTQFMKAMGDALRVVGATHAWKVSDTDEPGEGEHKVLQWLRVTQLQEGPIIVYGLDADLILLCLIAGDKLGAKHPIYLLREATAFGKLIRLDESKEAELCFFNIQTLRGSLENRAQWTKEQFYDYVFGMSFCGNDFLPTGLSLRIRDDGHSVLMNCLQDLWKSGHHLVCIGTDGRLTPNPDGLKELTKWMMFQEERLVISMIRRKMNSPIGDNDDDNLPLMEQSEKPLIRINHDMNAYNVHLIPNWDSVYNKLALGDTTRGHRVRSVTNYWKGWCWILDYYQGHPVDLEWVYPSGYPPTWKDLYELFTLPAPGSFSERLPLKPQEQLALVLPMSSWGLLIKTPFRNLPHLLPQYWPQAFRLETFGKRFGWECEPMIPMLTPERLRFEMTSMNTSN
jgi:5'-3' exonuclease